MSGKRLRPLDIDMEEQNNITNDFIAQELPMHKEYWMTYEEDGTVVQIDFDRDTSSIDISSQIQRMLAKRFDIERADSETILQQFEEKRSWTLGLQLQQKRARAMDQEYMSDFVSQTEQSDVDPYAIRNTILKLFRVVELSKHLVSAMVLAKTTQTVLPQPIFDSIVSHDSQSSRDKMKDHQELILYLLDEICMRGYRRVNNDIYRQVYIDRHATHAWVKECSIEQFLHLACNKETSYGYWFKLTQKLGVASAVTDFLTKTIDIQFPDLVADRHIISFNNGYLICNNLTEDNKLLPIFRTYEMDSLDNVHYDPNEKNYADIVSSVLHRLDFPRAFTEGAYNPNDLRTRFIDDGIGGIQTPELDSILTFQNLGPEVRYWVYVFIGRMLFDSNVYDNWQVMPFLKGVAGSGKSTIAYEVIARFYNPEDVFVISNNCEKKFGLQNCLQPDGKRLKYICIMPEVKQDFGMEQADWQQAVSGERIPINRKHMTTVTERFKLPMFAAGNQMVGYDDNSNSVARRVPVIKFNYPVGTRQDGDKPAKLRAELAHIILKCVFAYADAVNKYGKSQLWDHLPREFQEERNMLVQSQHPLMNYLCSGKVLMQGYLYIPIRTFVQHFKQHVQECCLSKFQWNSDFYELPFNTYGITVLKGKRWVYEGKTIHGTFLKGVDVINGENTPVQQYYIDNNMEPPE